MDYADDEQMEVSYLSTTWTIVASMGWYIVAILFSFWYALPHIQEKYTNWKMRREEQDYAAKYHKDPDLLQERLAALEASRQKMQQEYYKKCMLVQQDKKEREERKKASLNLIGAHLAGYKLGTEINDQLPSTEKKSRSLKGEYNPLMGDNSRRYYPPRRSCCGKGGCG